MAATTENKPLYAIAGAADAAIEVLRGLPNRIVEAASDTTIRDQVRTKVNELPEDAKTWRAEAGDFAEKLPARAHEFPGKVSEFLANVSHDAGKTYDGLAVRGEGFVAKLRSDYGPKVDEVVGTVKTRVAKASDDVEGAVTSLRSKVDSSADQVNATIEDAKPEVRDSATATKTAPTTKAATKKPAAKKAPAKKAPAKKASATKIASVTKIAPNSGQSDS